MAAGKPKFFSSSVCLFLHLLVYFFFSNGFFEFVLNGVALAGLAGTHDSWGPQIKGLTGTETPNDVESLIVDENLNDPDEIEVCSFDNRGMGRSSVPTNKSEYTSASLSFIFLWNWGCFGF